MTIIDRRKNSKGKSTANRKKFIERYKGTIKKQVDNLAKRRKIKDVAGEAEVTVDGISEPTFRNDTGTGNRDYVLPGNDQYSVGDSIRKPQGGKGKGSSGGPGEDGEDQFKFVLSKEEFMDLYFSDMGLPDFLKESMNNTRKFVYKKAGYSKEGIPARLNIKKTFEQSIARKVSAKGKKKVRFLDDEDIRYDYFSKQPKPVRTAVMFCLMDVSGSMTEKHKEIAKKFYLLLYLFLNAQYEEVEIRFVKHTESAKEVDEEDFFYSRETGGTIVSTGLELINDIIDKQYNLAETNFYLAQTSDGDNWSFDMTATEKNVLALLNKVQYFAYIDVDLNSRPSDLMSVYTPISEKYKNFNVKSVTRGTDVYEVLRELFKK